MLDVGGNGEEIVDGMLADLGQALEQVLLCVGEVDGWVQLLHYVGHDGEHLQFNVVDFVIL